MIIEMENWITTSVRLKAIFPDALERLPFSTCTGLKPDK
jgi:hypothetical protein